MAKIANGHKTASQGIAKDKKTGSSYSNLPKRSQNGHHANVYTALPTIYHRVAKILQDFDDRKGSVNSLVKKYSSDRELKRTLALSIETLKCIHSSS